MGADGLVDANGVALRVRRSGDLPQCRGLSHRAEEDVLKHGDPVADALQASCADVLDGVSRAAS